MSVDDRELELESRFRSPLPPLVDAAMAPALSPDGRMLTFGGYNGSLTGDVEYYGPKVSLSVNSGIAGSSLNVSGSNFASSATVTIYLGSVGGTVLGTATTNSSGVMHSMFLRTFIFPDSARNSLTDLVESRCSSCPCARAIRTRRRETA